MNKRTFLFNAICLTVSSLFMRSINLLYRSYLTEKIGAEGMGLYQLIFSVFIFAITVSTAGISLSVTRIISTAISAGKQHTVPSCIKKCILFSLSLSIPAAILLYFAAEWIGISIVEDMRVITPLQILAPGLPFMSICACIKGYFLAVRNVIRSMIGEFLEQAATISVTVTLFTLFAPSDPEHCCCAIMIGSTVGEAASCFSTWILYRLHLCKQKINCYEKSSRVMKQLCRIGLPITISAALRSGLSTIENILIPIGYRKNGTTAASALAEYGILNGMVLPVLFFPSAILTSFASLLVPELTEAMTLRKGNAIQESSAKAIRITLLFSIFTASFLGLFAEEIGHFFFRSEESSRLIQILSILIPLWYMDIVVDYFLKGLDQQFASMRFNFYDAAIRVGLISVLIPLFGTKGYLSTLFFSTIFNAVLSMHRLIKTTSVKISIRNAILLPAITAITVTFCIKTLLNWIPLSRELSWLTLIFGAIGSVLGYVLLLHQLGILSVKPYIFHQKKLQKIKRTAPKGCPTLKL